MKNISLEPLDAIVSNVVIDLSHWNNEVHFGLVKRDGIIAVIHKATQGVKYVDPRYETRQIAAKKKGLLWGAYHFGCNSNGHDQAEHFLKTVGNTSKTLLVLDLEYNGNNSMTLNQVETFLKTIKTKTKNPIIIYSSYYFLKKYASPFLATFSLWIASYNTTAKIPSSWNKWVLWQYTNGHKGLLPREVKGVGLCNRSKFNGSVEELKEFWLNGY